MACIHLLVARNPMIFRLLSFVQCAVRFSCWAFLYHSTTFRFASSSVSFFFFCQHSISPLRSSHRPTRCFTHLLLAADEIYIYVYILVYFIAASCKHVRCPIGQHCLEDQNLMPHCITCSITCPPYDPAVKSVTRNPKRLVCGNDGNTYRNLCELKRTACLLKRSIPVAYRGACKGM